VRGPTLSTLRERQPACPQQSRSAAMRYRRSGPRFPLMMPQHWRLPSDCDLPADLCGNLGQNGDFASSTADPPQQRDERLLLHYSLAEVRRVQLRDTATPMSDDPASETQTHAIADVFRTYGSGSCNPCRSGSTRDWMMGGRGMEDMVRIARPRMRGLRSAQSW